MSLAAAPAAPSATANQNRRRQLVKIATNKAILDISDALNKEPRRSKLLIILVDYSKQPSVQVRHYIDPDAAKVLAWEILNNTFPTTFSNGYTEYKGSPVGPDGGPEARVLTITYDSSRNYPYTVRIDRGDGQVTASGAIKMVNRKDSVSIPVSVFDMKRAAITILDYIRAWESRNLDLSL